MEVRAVTKWYTATARGRILDESTPDSCRAVAEVFVVKKIRMIRIGLFTVPMLVAVPVLAGAGVERWTALSRTAMAITGDISLSPVRLVAAGRTFPLSVAADVPAFATAIAGPVPARVLKVTKPADPELLHGNTLCGAPVRWIVAYRKDGGRSLALAAFSGEALPTGESDPGLCGTFSYSR